MKQLQTRENDKLSFGARFAELNEIDVEGQLYGAGIAE